MDKEWLQRTSLEVAEEVPGLLWEDCDECGVQEEELHLFIEKLLARIDAEWGREAVGEVIECQETVGFGRSEIRKTVQFDQSLPVGTKLFLSPMISEGMALVSTEILDRFPEINPSNYDHDDACALNAWGVELVLAAAQGEK